MELTGKTFRHINVVLRDTKEQDVVESHNHPRSEGNDTQKKKRTGIKVSVLKETSPEFGWRLDWLKRCGNDGKIISF